MRARFTKGSRPAAWLVVTFAVTSCGGPSVPREPAPTSVLSPRAESAPLPPIGASFEDDEDLSTLDHDEHEGHAGGEEEPPVTEAHDAGAPDGGTHHHGSHGHAH
ncbi:hypothetical protein [Sandaracinus amylolyticus]|uniref:hypothetical protein n=1 Tax=Sandaracinus amylolyticus TaxID=927083 RepID=UPI001F27B191|nr:hypothetical protein [Sandaracinus amylolyticus]